ncbi:SRPBCC domain-containing protein [Nocardia sp. NPDC051030]|uniref:SRPBCC family protein n=1 Tax=Nocardia sp. NPDC051030 TaxID=3155162 RepID=UPI0034403258
MIADSALNPAAVELGGFFRQAPHTIWRALTEPDLLGQWMVRPTGFAASVGTRFVFTVPDQPRGEIASEVLVVRPVEQLTYSWVYVRPEFPMRWIVEWTLRPQGRGTRLLLTQTGFDIEHRRQKMARNAMERGWRTTLSRLPGVLDRNGL